MESTTSQLIALCAGAVLLAVAMGLWSASLHDRLDSILDDNRHLADEVAMLAVLATPGLEELAADLELRRDTVAGLAAERTRALDVLSVVEASMPAAGRLTGLRLDDSGLELRGEGGPESAADLMDGLGSADCLAEVALLNAGAGEFEIRASLVAAEPCPAGGYGGRDPFVDLAALARTETARQVHPLRRWRVREYEVVAIEEGVSAIFEDPTGAAHLVQVGSMVGDGRARVAFVTEDQVVLTEDVVVDAETNQIESRIETLRLQR